MESLELHLWTLYYLKFKSIELHFQTGLLANKLVRPASSLTPLKMS